MRQGCAAIARYGLMVSAVLALTCNKSDFPTTPAPLASSATVQQGQLYQGSITLPDGESTSFNMTLIARGLTGQSPSSAAAETGFGHHLAATAPAAAGVELAGNFATGRGLKGAVRGTLAGSLAKGLFNGTLTTDTAGCSEERQYSGEITASGIAWLPGDRLRTCPANELTFAIQIRQTHALECRYTLSPTSVSFPGNGGRGSVDISTRSDCPWVADVRESWVRLDSRIGTGDRTVGFDVDENRGTDARLATLRIAGETFTVAQGPVCTYAIAPAAVNVAGGGGRGTLTVTAGDRCPWNLEGLVDWIAFSPAEGSGSSTLSYTVAANPGAERQASIRMKGLTFTVIQPSAPAPPPPPPVPCTYAIAPPSVSLASSGGSGTVTVTAPPGCAWSAQTSVNWLTILGSSSGSGSAALSYFVQPNQGASRAGAVQIAGQTFTVTQSALACTFSVSPTSAAVPQSGVTGTVVITTQSGCVWTAQPLVNWIVITDVSAGAGKDSVTYSVTANFGASRTGALQIAGQMVTVTQEGCTYRVEPTNVPFTSKGGSTAVVVTSPTGCAWTVKEGEDWIRVTEVSGDSGGTGGFRLVIDPVPSTDPAPRSASVIVGGPTTVTITVTQTVPAPSPLPDPDLR